MQEKITSGWTKNRVKLDQKSRQVGPKNHDRLDQKITSVWTKNHVTLDQKSRQVGPKIQADCRRLLTTRAPKFNTRTMHVKRVADKDVWFRISSPHSNFPINDHVNNVPSSSLEAPEVKQDQSANMISKPPSSK